MKIEQAKALFFAQYLGQRLCVDTKPDNLEYSQTPFDENEGGLFLTGILNSQVIVRRIAEDVKDRFEQTALLLRSVNQLTDEEAIQIAQIFTENHPNLYGKLLPKLENENPDGSIDVLILRDFSHIKSANPKQSFAYSYSLSSKGIRTLGSGGFDSP